MVVTFSDSPDLWMETDQLIRQLRMWDVTYLVGLDHGDDPRIKQEERMPPVELIQRLAQCDDNPRVRDASIALFLLHPELAGMIKEALQISEAKVREQIATLTLATLYLQRFWSFRLTLALGHPPNFPEKPFEFLWRERNLPCPAYHHGKWGLTMLEALEQRRSGLPINFLGDWQNPIDHLLWQGEIKHQRVEVSLPIPTDEQDEQEDDMSMRPPVDKSAIESFLKELGRTFRKPGRLYLVGGAALVHAGIRSGFTEDIDIRVSGENEGELIVAIQQLIRQMQINVEFASPADFIPLPSQWEMHAQYVGRYVGVDVFYFDFYSIALSKMERGNNRDIADIKLLLEKDIITLSELDQAYQDVLSQLGQGRYPRITPERFAERYAAVRGLLQQ